MIYLVLVNSPREIDGPYESLAEAEVAGERMAQRYPGKKAFVFQAVKSAVSGPRPVTWSPE